MVQFRFKGLMRKIINLIIFVWLDEVLQVLYVELYFLSINFSRLLSGLANDKLIPFFKRVNLKVIISG